MGQGDLQIPQKLIILQWYLYQLVINSLFSDSSTYSVNKSQNIFFAYIYYNV